MKEYIVQAIEQETIDSFEAHNAPELIRCKDCIHYRYYGLTQDTVSECTIDHCENPDKEWYCADGERRTDDALDNSKH